jgi:TatD DNase family protein
LIDSHVHLNHREFAGESIQVVARARQAGVQGFLNVGYDLDSSRQSLALAAADPGILATVGIHPHDALLLADEQETVTAAGQAALAELEEMAADPRVVAIGEIGLDYYRDLSPRPAQRAALTAQLALADRVGLPVVFHVRDAWAETLEHIDRCGVPRAKGVLHSFSGDAAAVAWARERGFFLGIGGPVTYKNSQLPALVALAGVDMILLETDAPWLPPVPFRGKRNEPSYLPHTLHKVAEILAEDPRMVARRTTESFCRLFGEPAAPWLSPWNQEGSGE